MLIHMEENMEEKIKMPLGQRLKAGVIRFSKIFSEYPFTIGALIIAAVFGAILIDYREVETVELWLMRAACFCMFFVPGSIWCEEKLLAKTKFWGLEVPGLIFRGVFLGISAFISGTMVYILEHADEDMIFGYSSEIILSHAMKLYWTYACLIIILALYSMYKRSGKSFERYCIGVFGQTLKVTIIYSIFAIGIAIILEIVDILILDIYGIDLIARVELILAGAIYAPAMIKACSQIKDDISKFFKIVVLYALFILLLASFAVIYIYIFKIIFITELPSNEVFGILGWLFALGLPVWTMAMYFDDKKLGKIARFMPFVFAPFIILQIICLGMRLSDYGFTSLRYFALMLVIFEIIYVALYAVRMGKFIDKIVFMAPVFCFVVFLMPGLNVESVCINSQARILAQYMDRVDELTAKEMVSARTSYNEIRYSGYMGERYLKGNYSKKERELIESWSSYYWEGEDFVPTKYYSWYENSQDIYDYEIFIDISRYTELKYVEISEYEIEGYDNIVLGDGEVAIKADFSELCDGIKEDDEFFENHNFFHIADGYDIYVRRFSIREKDGKPDSFQVAGFLLKY